MSAPAHDQIAKDIAENDVLLFMKGTPVFPQCGFSAAVVQILSELGVKFKAVDVLKDASSTAIYGARAANGVVLISTKRGKAGEVKVNYGFTYSLQEKPKNLAVMTLPQFAQMTNEIRSITGGTPPPEFANPSLLGPGTNWQDALFKTAPLTKHQLSLSGGSEKTTFYLSGEHFNQEGVALGSSFARSSIQQNRRWSKSSPPSAASPLVAITSNTPFESFRIEMSNVPPPRS